MRTRYFIPVLLLATSALAKTIPDFSGVFLRISKKDNVLNFIDKDPLVLEVKQSPERVEMTITENGESSSTTYAINDAGATTKFRGVSAVSKAKLRDQGLFLESVINEASALGVGKALKITEKLKLS